MGHLLRDTFSFAVSSIFLLFIFLNGNLCAQSTPATRFAYGTVVNVGRGHIVVSEYDEKKDEEIEETFFVTEDTEFQNVQSLQDITIDDEVDIAYEVADGKNVIRSITVDTADETVEGSVELMPQDMEVSP